MNVVGIDGCKFGWIAINLRSELIWDVKLYSGINEMLEVYKKSDCLLIDMPIGLKTQSKEERLCDKEIRRVLKYPRGMSVFVVPTRAAIYCDSYSEGNNLNKKLVNKGISKQLWGIVPKIKSLDQYLIENEIYRNKVKESHPELAFMMLKGKAMDYSKRKKEGFIERIELLEEIYPKTREIVNYTLDTFQRKEVKRDDILDALVLAINAYLGEKYTFKKYPNSTIQDSKRLEMSVTVLDYELIKKLSFKELRSVFNS